MQHFTVPVSVVLAIACFQLAAHTAALSPAPADWRCGEQCGDPRNPNRKCEVKCAGAECRPLKGNINGQVLILDVASNTYLSDPPEGNPKGCCDACKATDGCNSWTYCSKKNGCGKGCNAYLKALRSDQTNATFRFGSFHQCTTGDAWPYQMCSLKRVAIADKPALYPNGEAEGWVSGTIKPAVAAGCPADVTAETCKMCNAAKNSTACYACVRAKAGYGVKKICGGCASLGLYENTLSLQDACVKPYLRGDYNLCHEQYKSNSDVKALEKCIASVWALCRGFPGVSNPKICYNCIMTAGADPNCNVCADLPTIAANPCLDCVKQRNTACTACISSNKTLTSTCFTCYDQGPDAETKSRCSSCLVSKNPGTCFDCLTGQGAYSSVPPFARKGCASFDTLFNDKDAAWKAGIACLKAAKNANDVGACISCSMKSSKGALACLAQIPKQKTALGKLYTGSCFMFEGQSSDKCLACIDAAKSTTQAEGCVSLLYG